MTIYVYREFKKKKNNCRITTITAYINIGSVQKKKKKETNKLKIYNKKEKKITIRQLNKKDMETQYTF